MFELHFRISVLALKEVSKQRLYTRMAYWDVPLQNKRQCFFLLVFCHFKHGDFLIASKGLICTRNEKTERISKTEEQEISQMGYLPISQKGIIHSQSVMSNFKTVILNRKENKKKCFYIPGRH